MAKICIFEEGTELALNLKKSLESLDFDVLLMTKHDNIVREVKSLQPDLVLIDFVLKGIDGCEVLKLLKKDAQTKKIPIVVYTSISEEIGYNIMMSCGAYDYIVKSDRPVKQCALMIKTILNEVKHDSA